MEISNFSSLIEVGVALNIACVAIEYVKSYNDVLCNQVFNLKHKIETAVIECRSKLNEVMDETTLTNLPNTMVGGRNTEGLKQRLLRSRETLTQDIKDKQNALTNDITKVCEVKSVSSICLWLFLYGIAALVLMGFEIPDNSENNSLIHQFWITLTILGTLFSVIGWYRNANDRPWWKFDYCSLRFSILSFGISVILCFLSLFLHTLSYVVDFVNSIWKGVLLYSMILVYSNFVVSAIKVWNKAQEGINKIKVEKNALLERCNAWNDEVGDLQGALHTGERLAAVEEHQPLQAPAPAPQNAPVVIPQV